MYRDHCSVFNSAFFFGAISKKGKREKKKEKYNCAREVSSQRNQGGFGVLFVYVVMSNHLSNLPTDCPKFHPFSKFITRENSWEMLKFPLSIIWMNQGLYHVYITFRVKSEKKKRNSNGNFMSLLKGGF